MKTVHSISHGFLVRKAFEVILVPLDVDEKLWELHMSKMPWLSIPLKNRDAWNRLDFMAIPVLLGDVSSITLIHNV
jgi:hypothetical protein